MHFWNFPLLALLVIVLAVSACIASAAPATRSNEDFPISTPEEQGIDSAKLLELCNYLNDGPHDIRSLLIIRNGHLVFERYEQHVSPDDNHYIYSATKSFTSTLIGIALDKKLIKSISEPAFDLLNDIHLQGLVDPRKKRITLRNLLMMESGLEYLNRDETGMVDTRLMTSAPDSVKWVMERPMVAAPGVRFNYSNGDTELLGGVLTRASKLSLPQFARENLFRKLGFYNWEWIGADKTGQHPGAMGLRLRPRDMAKLGQLFLQNGRWNNEQLVSTGWVHAATMDQTKEHYGYQWWADLNDAGHSSYSAIGLKGQYIRVIPDLHTVIVMTAVLPIATKNETFNQIARQFVVPAIKNMQALKPNVAAVTDLRVAIQKANQLDRAPIADTGTVDTPHSPKTNQ